VGEDESIWSIARQTMVPISRILIGIGAAPAARRGKSRRKCLANGVGMDYDHSQAT